MTNRKLILNLIGIFVFGFCFIYAAYVGLPVDFNADHVNNVKGTESVSYAELARMTLNPFTPAWFYPAEGRMEYLRPLQFLLMKFFFETFRYDLVPVHIAAAVGHGLLLVAFALILYFFSGGVLLGWLAALLYASFPSNFFMMTSVFSMDFQYLVSLLAITSLCLFAVLTAKKSMRRLPLVLTFLGWIVAMWFAIKLKSSEKVLPLIMGAFLLVRTRFILKRIGWQRIVIVILLLVCTTPLVAPLKCFERWTPRQMSIAPSIQTSPVTIKDKTTFAFKWENLLARTFFVPGGEFPFSTIHRRLAPRSFSENYGFFLGWFFWLGLVWLLWFLLFFKIGSNVADERVATKRHCAWLIVIWFAACIAGFSNGISIYDTRLLNFAYVPSVLLLFVTASFLIGTYFHSFKQQVCAYLLIATLVLFTSLANYSILGKLLGHFGGMQDAIVRSGRDVFLAVHRAPPEEKIFYEKYGELESRVAVIDWYELPVGWQRVLDEKLKREGTVYFFSRSADSERLQKLKNDGYAVVFWKRYDFLDAKPLFFRIQKMIFKIKLLFRKSKKGNAVLVYQIRSKPMIRA